MSSIVVIGWKPGFDKIGMNKLLRDQLGYSLGDAKYIVDAIIENKATELVVPSEVFEQIMSDLINLGSVLQNSAAPARESDA